MGAIGLPYPPRGRREKGVCPALVFQPTSHAPARLSAILLSIPPLDAGQRRRARGRCRLACPEGNKPTETREEETRERDERGRWLAAAGRVFAGKYVKRRWAGA